jgi:hypothetical protein
LDELINDYEVTTVGGLNDGTFAYPSKVKIDLEEISARSD